MENPLGSKHLSSPQIAASENTQKVDAGPLFGVKDSFWDHLDNRVRVANWNKAFPYQLMVVQRTEGGGWVETAAKFTLPISPESLTISTPYAITTSVTLGGIVEEHNGAPLRTVNITGTTGVLPLRGQANQAQTTSFAQAIAAGTISNIQRTQNTLSGLSTLFSGQISPNLLDDSDITDSTDVGKGSGYFQFRLLQNFLEKYIALKKTTAGRPFRLALAIWKDEAIYLVTPQQFALSRTAGDPFSYNYNINLKAWRRIKLNGSGAPELGSSFSPTARDPNTFARILRTLDQARRLLQNVKDVLSSVSGDIDRTLFEPMRETALFLKDGLGVATTTADIPNNILKNLSAPLLEWASLNGSIRSGLGAELGRISDDRNRLADQLAKLNSSTGNDETGNGSPANIHFGTPGAARQISPVFNALLADPAKFYSALSQVRLGDLNIPASTISDIVRERDRVSRLTRLDFELFRNNIEQASLGVADALGLGNSTYNNTFGRTPRPTIKQPTAKDYEVLFTLNAVILEMNRLAATGKNDRVKLSSIDLVAALSTQAGIPFRVPNSKFAVPFPYGSTLEALALRYLGTPDRWHEIAVLNSLREPFIDEEGFDLPLLVNGNENFVMVSDAANLYVNQLVYISSNATPRAQRRVTGIQKISPIQFLIAVDGEGDMSRFTTLARATLHAFLPGTVNSQMLVYIPSDKLAAEEDFQGKSIPGLNELDAMLRVGGVDLLLTQKNDLVITPDGDQRLAIGLANIIQNARIRLSIFRGSLLHHPELGLNLKIGQSTADLNAADLIVAAKELFSDDPTFIGVVGAGSVKNGPTATLGLSIVVAGVNQPIPISVHVQR